MIITRHNGYYEKGYFKSLHDFYSKNNIRNMVTAAEKKAERIRRFRNQFNKLIQDINYCIVKSLKKKKSYPIISDKFEISANTASFLSNFYEVNGTFKKCEIFFNDYPPISSIYINERNITKLDSLKAKIFRRNSLKFSKESNLISFTKPKFFFCIEFKKLEIIVN